MNIASALKASPKSMPDWSAAFMPAGSPILPPLGDMAGLSPPLCTACSLAANMTNHLLSKWYTYGKLASLGYWGCYIYLRTVKKEITALVNCEGVYNHNFPVAQESLVSRIVTQQNICEVWLKLCWNWPYKELSPTEAISRILADKPIEI